VLWLSKREFGFFISVLFALDQGQGSSRYVTIAALCSVVKYKVFFALRHVAHLLCNLGNTR
jgi:hypothetical protein